MLEEYLQNAIVELETLISMTREDIRLVKEAAHDDLAAREAAKLHALRQFESTKNMLNQELLSLSKEGDMQENMSPAISTLLDAFKEKLEALKSTNKELSKLVIPVNEFFSSLFQGMFHFDSNGYKTTTPKPAAMLRVSA